MNAAEVYESNGILSAALVKLLAGEEVTVSYIDLSVTVMERRSRLQQGWHFTCMCPRCTVEAALPQGITNMVAAIQDHMQYDENHPARIMTLYR